MRWFCTLKRNAFSQGGVGYPQAHTPPPPPRPPVFITERSDISSLEINLPWQGVIYPLNFKCKRRCLYIVEMNLTRLTGTLLR